MAPSVPCEDVDIWHVEAIDEVDHAPGVFVAAVEDKDGLVGGLGCGPMAVEEFGAVVDGDGVVFAGAIGMGSYGVLVMFSG